LAHEYLAKISGKQVFNAPAREDYPAVGDWVAITELDAERATIHRVLPRKTVLKRKYIDQSEPQVIASNIDVAFIIESVGRDYNLNRFERYLALVIGRNIEPVMVINKIDLIAGSELNRNLSQVTKRFKDIDVIPTSTILDAGLNGLTARILRGETYCFLGSSGVGKSSLINKLLGKEIIKTNTISHHTGKGKHTTTGREMYFMENGGIVIDNPGMREIGLVDSNAGIENVFEEIKAIAKKCKFKDCTHVHEPGCAVRDAVESGEFCEDKYSNYLKLTREAEHYEKTKLEKRGKDRQLGKFIKKAQDQQKQQES